MHRKNYCTSLIKTTSSNRVGIMQQTTTRYLMLYKWFLHRKIDKLVYIKYQMPTIPKVEKLKKSISQTSLKKKTKGIPEPYGIILTLLKARKRDAKKSQQLWRVR